MVVIVDCGIGNVGSIRNMLHRIGVESLVSGSSEEILAADKLILPGVGSFDSGMTALAERGLIAPLRRRVLEEKTPILGICLGMQLMATSSREGHLAGLGWIDAEVVRFDASPESERLRIPHMGWNTVRPVRTSWLFPDVLAQERFYFVHSYHVACSRPEDVLCVSRHGVEFVSAIQRQNICGVQFHPEKSHRYGMSLLKRFSEQN